MGRAVNPHITTLIAATFGISADVPMTAGQWTELGRLTVPAGVAYSLGFGKFSALESALGRIFLAAEDDTDAVEEGMIRIDLHNPQDRVIKTVFESRTERMRMGATTPSERFPFQEQGDLVGEDFSFVLKMKSDATDAFSATNSSIQIDATIYDIE